MAKVTETTVVPEPVKPPRTFTLDLSEEELAAIIVLMSRTSGSNLKTWAIDNEAKPWSEMAEPAAKVIRETYVAPGVNYDLFDVLVGAFNA